jgi:hypothetical protein
MTADTEAKIAALENRMTHLEDQILLQNLEIEALETALARLESWPRVPEPLTVLRNEKLLWTFAKLRQMDEVSPAQAARIRELLPGSAE